MIELRRLTKAFGRKIVLRGIDLRVAAGESLVIFGPNGAGKTTLIRILAGLSRPTGGTLTIGGLDMATHADGIRRYLGVVSHAPLLYDSLTAEENLRFFARLYGMKRPEARIAGMLEQVGLSHAGMTWCAPTRAGWCSGWRSPGRCCTTRRCSCSTSRTPGSIRRRPRCCTACWLS